MNIKTPPSWRKGQTLFNFLEWLHTEKGGKTDQSPRMADPFYYDDENFDKLFKEFMRLHE